MIRTAFSTVACHTWTLERVVSMAARWGFMGVELRSFGQGGADFACDPALTDGAKVRRLFDDAGVEIAGLASGVRFDQPVFPPVIGHVLPAAEASVREGRHMVQVALECGAPSVRVFGFEVPRREGVRSAARRIAQRLEKVCDHARGRDVMVLLENGGGFPKASDLMQIIDRINSPLLAVCYDGATAHAAGESLEEGCALLGPRLKAARLRDERDDGRPCRLGTGRVPCSSFVRAVRENDAAWGTDPWLVYNWDRAWLPELSPADEVMPSVVPLLAEWGAGSGRTHKFDATQSSAPAMVLGW